jgi:hypothetical protein
LVILTKVALPVGHPLPLGRFLVFISVTGWVLRQGNSAAGRTKPLEKSLWSHRE